MFVASVDTTFLGHRAGLHPADYAYLRDLDRAGWAWEWLRRNPDFASVKLTNEARTSTGRPGVIRLEAASERTLLRWGLHYG